MNNSSNTVADVLKGYGILNAVAGVIVGLVLLSKESTLVGIVFIAIVLVASFGIYAFGEVVELLHQIKMNTTVNSLSEKSGIVAEKSSLFEDLPNL